MIDQPETLQEPADAPDAYAQWQVDRSPQSLARVVKDYEPMIRGTLSNIGAGQDPQLYSRARVLTAKAVETYNPEYGASLPTWVSRQLMPLRRMKRETQSSIRIPEGIQLDAYKLSRAQEEYMDEHDREPDLLELSDRTGLSVQRIKKVREKNVSVPSDAAISGVGGDDDKAFNPAHSEPDWTTEASDYVYHEVDYLDRKIMEHLMGYAGSEVMQGKDLADQLGISASQVSRRAARLAYKINEYRRILES